MGYVLNGMSIRQSACFLTKRAMALIADSPSRSRFLALDAILVAAATIVMAAELFLGTDVGFAFGVYAILVIVIITWRFVGFGSIAGIMLAYNAFDFLALGQFFKVLYLQPADSNLRAADPTIFVLFLGFAALCLAAIIVSLTVRRPVINVNPLPKPLALMRNICFGIGVSCIIVIRFTGNSESGDLTAGGLVGMARDLLDVGFLCISLETWRALTLSEGRRSMSWQLLAMMAFFGTAGLLFDSKYLMIEAAILYLITSIAYRRRVTGSQLFYGAIGIFFFIMVFYPVIHILRGQSVTGVGLDASTVVDYLGEIVENPGRLSDDWQAYKDMNFDTGTYGESYDESLNYFGTYDELLARFVLIANTDGIVDVVDRDGVYGPSLLTDGLGAILPTFVFPNKQRFSSGDLLTWFYGMRPIGIAGNPTVGLFASSYATLGFAGAFLIPFVFALIFLFEVQITGRFVAGNLIGGYLLATNVAALGGADVGSAVALALRGIPEHLLIIIGLFYLCDFFVTPKSASSAPHRELSSRSEA